MSPVDIFILQGGMYVLQLMNNYAASYTTLIIGLTECIALSWVYGKSGTLIIFNTASYLAFHLCF